MLLGLLAGLVICFFLGNIILFFLDSKKVLHPVENLSISFLLGSGAITLLLFWSIFVDLPYRVLIVGGIVFGLFILKVVYLEKLRFRDRLFFALKAFSVRFQEIISISPKKVILILLILLIIFKLSYAFVETLSKPEYSWDASACWTSTGKYLFHINRDQPGQISKIFFHLPHGHTEYPNMIQIMHFWLFTWMGQAHDQWSKIFFPINLLFFLILFYTSLRKVRSNLEASFFSYVLFSSPLFLYLSTIGYADFTISIYFSLGILFFYQWMRDKKDVYFWLFSVFLAFTTWIKIEGKPLFVLGFIILLFYLWHSYNKPLKASLLKVGQYLFAFMVIGFPWQLFVMLNRIPTREKLAFHFMHFFDLHSQIYIKLFVEGSWGIFWFIAVGAVAFFWKKLFNRENIYFTLTFLLFYGIIIFIYLFTDDGYQNFGLSFNRVWLSIYPIMVFALACITPRFKNLFLFRDRN